ncbi:unnamed protein product, partial [Ixodes pacificus]
VPHQCPFQFFVLSSFLRLACGVVGTVTELAPPCERPSSPFSGFPATPPHQRQPFSHQQHASEPPSPMRTGLPHEHGAVGDGVIRCPSALNHSPDDMILLSRVVCAATTATRLRLPKADGFLPDNGRTAPDVIVVAVCPLSLPSRTSFAASANGVVVVGNR